jgi:hypothetical protein
MTLTISDIEGPTDGRFGTIDVPCPRCGPDKRGAASQRRRVLRIWRGKVSFATFKCMRCDLQGYARANSRHAFSHVGNALPTWKSPRKITTPDQSANKQRDKARWLWSRRLPIEGSIAERYLRDARGYSGVLPGTMGFLPAAGDRPAAMISAIGLPVEIEPGVIGAGDIAAVHLTKLSASGLAKAGTDSDKIVVGSPRGMPIAVAALNDGLGLAIAEGIEDAFSMHEATGLGAWAAGSAPFLPHLADSVPTWVECITIVVDDDNAGRRKSDELATLLETRGFEVRLFVPAWARSIAA